MTTRCYAVGTKLFPLCTKIGGDEDSQVGQPVRKAEQAEQPPSKDTEEPDQGNEEAVAPNDAMQRRSEEKDALPEVLSESNELRAEELSAFRDQCAAGVLQAIQMIQVLEHQLRSEQGHRQRAEADVKVLLSAVHVERNVATDAVLDMHAKLQEEECAQIRAGQQSRIPVDELPTASSAATSIQKHFRGHVARRQFQERLIRVLQGIDPTLVPANQPSLARPQHLKQQQQQQQQQHQQQQHTVLQPPQLSLEALRTEVENIEHRAQGQQGQQQQQPRHGQQGEGSLASMDDALTMDVRKILKGPLPAGAVGCIAALVRRCKDLQAALATASEELAEARRAEQGLRQQNAGVIELSQMRIALEQERTLNKQLRQALAQLQHAVHGQQQAVRRPQSAGLSGFPIQGVTLDIEKWEDLRASASGTSFLLPTAPRHDTPVPAD